MFIENIPTEDSVKAVSLPTQVLDREAQPHESKELKSVRSLDVPSAYYL
jgi:hypothetical protein